ncbi:hypothetical protein JI739_10830 [Ramlibacter sp. AW1]|uniref:Lipoprotein n=1 Tax=Ramlibacter aurantiacus TaxID=2801330 RepID=A0A936ZUI7_9BURK|nr:hypothetical protein [Ramlibacter aurantiacus]MBL0420839.1 hypothetical protein [Ramlibacter aurantiacus]
MKRPGPLGRLKSLAAGGLAGLLAACAPNPVSRGTVAGTPPGPVPPPPGVSGQPPRPDEPTVAPARPSTPGTSLARTAREYRRDGAGHLYKLYANRIYAGRLPPMLYAVGVLEVELDARGEPRRLHWLRAPKHAPEVVGEIEKLVRAAAPYPVPLRLGKVTYTDTWLWDRSGRFQLDTLTEGQD